MDKQKVNTGSKSPDSSIGQYLNEVGTFSLLNKDDEIRLSQSIQNGIAIQEEVALTDTRPSRTQEKALRKATLAKSTFINANLRLVVSMATKFTAPSGAELLHLIQENLGLEHTVDKSDWRKGYKFQLWFTLD